MNLIAYHNPLADFQFKECISDGNDGKIKYDFPYIQNVGEHGFVSEPGCGYECIDCLNHPGISISNSFQVIPPSRVKHRDSILLLWENLRIIGIADRLKCLKCEDSAGQPLCLISLMNHKN